MNMYWKEIKYQRRLHWGVPLPPLFTAKRKKGKQRKKRVSKQKVLKGFHQGQDVTVLAIPERLEFKKSSCRSTMAIFHGPFTLKSISPALNKTMNYYEIKLFQNNAQS